MIVSESLSHLTSTDATLEASINTEGLETTNLSKALKACDKKPKKQRPSCKRQAEKKYAVANKKKS